MDLSARPRALRATWAVVALLLVCGAFPAAECSRSLKQVTDLAEAERLADLFLDEFLSEIGIDENGNPLLDDWFDDYGSDGSEGDVESTSTPAPTSAPTPGPTTPAPTVPIRRVVEVEEVYPPDNPWNPICNASDVELPVVKVGDKTFHGTNKEKFTMYVPPEYEIKAWAVVRTKNWSGFEPGIGAVKSKGLNFIAEVSPIVLAAAVLLHTSRASITGASMEYPGADEFRIRAPEPPREVYFHFGSFPPGGGGGGVGQQSQEC